MRNNCMKRSDSSSEANNAKESTHTNLRKSMKRVKFMIGVKEND